MLLSESSNLRQTPSQMAVIWNWNGMEYPTMVFWLYTTINASHLFGASNY